MTPFDEEAYRNRAAIISGQCIVCGAFYQRTTPAYKRLMAEAGRGVGADAPCVCGQMADPDDDAAR